MAVPPNYSPSPSSSSWPLVQRQQRLLENRPGSMLAVLAALAGTFLFWAMFVA